jgi:Domain of unknown function (DUF4352)
MRTPRTYLIAALCGLMILVACTAGCTSSNTSPSPSAQAAGNASTSASASAAAQSSAAVNISVRYVGSPHSIGPNNATPSDGYTYALYNVTIKDVNQSDYLVLPTAFMLKLSNGNFSAQPYIVGYKEALGGTNGTYTIQPGQTASGTIVYEVPKNVSPQTIVYRMANPNGTVDERTFDASVS